MPVILEVDGDGACDAARGVERSPQNAAPAGSAAALQRQLPHLEGAVATALAAGVATAVAGHGIHADHGGHGGQQADPNARAFNTHAAVIVAGSCDLPEWKCPCPTACPGAA